MVTDKQFVHFFPPFNSKLADRRPGGRETWYICKQCRRAFPRYMVDDKSWRASGFRVGAICKHCLEERVPNPKYQTLEEYTENRKQQRNKIAKIMEKNHPGEKSEWTEADTKRFKEFMLDTWDKEEEPIPLDRTNEELEAMLSKGECTIAYANAPKDVKAMCRLCANETCPGPYVYGDWETEEYMSQQTVEQVMETARNIKPKPLKVTKRKSFLRDEGTKKICNCKMEDNMRVRTACHEAGHAILNAIIYPRQTKTVSIKPDEESLGRVASKGAGSVGYTYRSSLKNIEANDISFSCFFGYATYAILLMGPVTEDSCFGNVLDRVVTWEDENGRTIIQNDKETYIYKDTKEIVPNPCDITIYEVQNGSYRDMAFIVDTLEIDKLDIDQCLSNLYSCCIALLKSEEVMNGIQAIATALLEKEILTGKEVREIVKSKSLKKFVMDTIVTHCIMSKDVFNSVEELEHSGNVPESA